MSTKIGSIKKTPRKEQIKKKKDEAKGKELSVPVSSTKRPKKSTPVEVPIWSAFPTTLTPTSPEDKDTPKESRGGSGAGRGFSTDSGQQLIFEGFKT